MSKKTHFGMPLLCWRDRLGTHQWAGRLHCAYRTGQSWRQALVCRKGPKLWWPAEPPAFPQEAEARAKGERSPWMPCSDQAAADCSSTLGNQHVPGPGRGRGREEDEMLLNIGGNLGVWAASCPVSADRVWTGSLRCPQTCTAFRGKTLLC